MMTVNFTKSNKNKKISRRDSELFLSSSDYSQLFKNEKLKTLKDYWLDFNWIYQKKSNVASIPGFRIRSDIQFCYDSFYNQESND